MRLHKDILWLLGSAAAAIAAAPLLVQGDAVASARRTAAAQRIEQLSPAERQRLDENFRRFEKLPAADQEKYREIHARIEQNPAVGEALDTFSQWWPTVSAREQAQLFKQTSVRERVAIVSQIQDEVDRDRAVRVYVGRGWGRDWQRPDTFLPRDSFYEIMAAIEQIEAVSYLIPNDLPEIQKIDSRSPQRALKLLTALHQKQQTWSTLVASPATESRIVESISNEKVRESVRQRIGERFLGMSRGFRLRSALVMALAKELYLEGLKQNFGEDDLRRKLDELSQDDKAELYSFAADDSRFQLRSRVFSDMRAAFEPVPEFFQITGRAGDGRGRGDGPARGDGPGRGEFGRGEGGGRGGDSFRGEGFGRGGDPGRGDNPPRPN